MTEREAVLVTGATGFIGRHLVRSLSGRGLRVVALVRPGRTLVDQGGAALVEKVEGDVTDLRSLIRASRLAARIVHLAGAISLRGTSNADAFRTNVAGTMNVLDAARATGAARLVVIGTQSDNRGSYATTKRQADALVLASKVPHVVLRPSLVYGPDAGGVFASVAGLVRRLPIIPLIGGGSYPMAPVYVDDVCNAIGEALVRPDLEPAYDLSGPRVITFRDLLEHIARSQGLTRRFVSVPYLLAALGINVAERVHFPLPVTSDTLEGLVHPSLRDSTSARRDLGFAPIDIEDGLRRTFG